MFSFWLLDGTFQIVCRVIADKLLLDGITQDSGDILFNPCCYFKIAKDLHFFNGSKQITGIQLVNVFITTIWKNICVKTGLDGALVIFRPFLFSGKPRFGYSPERAGIIEFCFQLLNFGLFSDVRVNALSKKPFGLVTALSCVRKRNNRVNIYREDYLLAVEAVNHLPLFGPFRGNAKEHIKAIGQLAFLTKGCGVFYFSISKWHNDIPHLLVKT